MASPRFYVPLDPALLDHALEAHTEIALPEKAAHHARRALRLRNGESVTVFAGTGSEWQGTIHIAADSASVAITGKDEPHREPPVRMTLVQALVAPEKLDWIIEKAVETGVTEIVLTPAERSVTRLTGDRLNKRLLKCRNIAVGAAEQCGRNVIPDIRATQSFKAALLDTKADVRLLLAPGASENGRFPAGTASVAFAVGPEGGYSAAEISQAAEAGWQPVLLGPRVLRTETAGLAAAVWINTVLGDYPRN